MVIEPDPDSSDDLLARADALLARHRRLMDARPPEAAPALLTDAVVTQGADIPTLTDIVPASATAPRQSFSP